MKNVIIYTRVSTDDQAKVGYSLAHQKCVLERYCKFHKLHILKHYQDDYSAKDFERPEFNALLNYCKSNKRIVDSLLFTRWDRFSRNTTESYNMLRTFDNLGVGISCVEQPLDLTQPDSKLMLAIYLSSSEIENDKNSIRTKEGMRRAMREGYWVGHPPRGYSRMKTENNKPTLIQNEDASIIKKIFTDFSSGLYSAEALRKKYYKRIKIQKQSFLNLLRGHVYTGQILIKEWRKEEEEIVEAVHEPIINKNIFEKVQKLLNKNKKIKIVKEHPDFILRQHLICNQCGNKLTGSFSTSRSKDKYPYYHCQRGCKERYPVKLADEEFKGFLKQYELKAEMSKLFVKMMDVAIKEKEDGDTNILRKLDHDINKYNQRVISLEDKFIDGDVKPSDYKKLSSRYNIKIASLNDEKNNIIQLSKTRLMGIKSTVKLLSNLSDFYNKIDLPLKKKLIGSIFKNGVIFNGKKYRTTKENELLNLIFLRVSNLKKLSIKKAGKNTRLSSYAPPTGLISNHLLKDLHDFHLLYKEIQAYQKSPSLN